VIAPFHIQLVAYRGDRAWWANFCAAGLRCRVFVEDDLGARIDGGEWQTIEEAGAWAKLLAEEAAATYSTHAVDPIKGLVEEHRAKRALLVVGREGDGTWSVLAGYPNKWVDCARGFSTEADARKLLEAR
jgi:hypothetical protein